MIRQDVDEEDLRTEIYSLRKHISRVCGENQILKVKIRKLQDEMITRDKHLDEFLRSKRFFGLPKNLEEKGASALINLKLKNDKLEQNLLEKEMMIKRLQNTLQTAKLYNASSLTKKFVSKGIECNLSGDNRTSNSTKNEENTKIELHIPNFDMGDYEFTNATKLYSKDLITVKNNDVKEIESEFLLGSINLGSKQQMVPSYCSETFYESRSASYHKKVEGSQPDTLLLEEYIRIPNEKITEIREDISTIPEIRKILETLRELTKIGSKTDFNAPRTATIDESVQFPHEDTELLKIEEVEGLKSQYLEGQQKAPNQLDMASNGITEKVDCMEKNENVIEERPHEEIKQLHVYLMDMISQVDTLKDIISQMKSDQVKTESDLKSKDQSIDKLAKEIEELRELKCSQPLDISKMHQLKSNVVTAEKDNALLDSYESMQKSTRRNIKKIAGKMKNLKETKSKLSIGSQNEKKTSRSSSQNSKREKMKISEKSMKKLEKKVLDSEYKKPIGIGSGDLIDVPFFRCGFSASSADRLSKNEFDELD